MARCGLSRLRVLAVVGFLAGSVAVSAATATQAGIPERPFGTLREQTEVQQHWLRQRLELVLPRLMREYGFDMWVVPMREYNEDPVFRALVSPTTFAARRRSIYVFYDRGPERGVERIALGGTSQGDVYEAMRETELAPDGRRRELWGPSQWSVLARIIGERNPQRIAVNISQVHNFADGLSAGEWEQMQQALPPQFQRRVERAEGLAVDYLAIRVPAMNDTYRRMQQLVHEIIGTAFSSAVITPGVTTTDDVVWWFRQRVNDLGLGTWFQPSVSVQRWGAEMADSTAPVIQRGDVLHCDFGITALRLNTDTQHMGYVLREGEVDAPEGLKSALRNANRLQDIVLAEMTPGRTGNEILFAAQKVMRSETIDGTVYTHPIGDHGHGAGPLIGLWDRQDGVPGRGDIPIRAGTWHSIELQATTAVPEWNGQRVQMALEEEAELTAEAKVQWVWKRQKDLHIVR